MNPTVSNLPEWIPLPAELSAKAREVPGLPERLVRFIRLEVAMNERRQHRHSPEALALVERARARVAERKAVGTERAVAMQEFHANYTEIINAL